MTKTPSFPLLEHPAFRGVSDASVSRLERECSVFRFDLGAQLSEPNEIPARILVILQGPARLVGRHNGRLTTVGKFGPGSVIGAASLLGGSPCENVIAAEEMIACGISDELWRELYATEASFRRWCDQQLKLKAGSSLPLQVGMSLTANIKLRKVSYLQLLLGEFQDTAESLQRL